MSHQDDSKRRGTVFELCGGLQFVYSRLVVFVVVSAAFSRVNQFVLKEVNKNNADRI